MKGDSHHMTINSYCKKNRISDLPIMPICNDTEKTLAYNEWLDKVWVPDAIYDIGFFNSEGNEDETQFDIHGTRSMRQTISELTELFADFCKENGFSTRKVLYVSYAGKIDD